MKQIKKLPKSAIQRFKKNHGGVLITVIVILVVCLVANSLIASPDFSNIIGTSFGNISGTSDHIQIDMGMPCSTMMGSQSFFCSMECETLNDLEYVKYKCINGGLHCICEV